MFLMVIVILKPWLFLCYEKDANFKNTNSVEL